MPPGHAALRTGRGGHHPAYHPGDAPVLAELLRASRDFLEPWEPVHSDDYFTGGGQDHAMYQLVSTIRS